ncbi:MAG: AAA family ATPase [Pseudomonadota bacterium]
MLDSHKQQIADALIAYMATNGISQNKLKDLTGVSAGYLSAIVNGTYNAVPVKGGTVAIGDQHFRKIQQFLGMTAEVFETRNYTDIMFALAQAKKNAGASIVDGNTGAGKTFTLTEFQRLFPAATYVVKCSNSMTPRMMVLKLAEVVGVMAHGDNNTVIRLVADKLGREASPLVIFDEMETMLKKRLAVGFIKDLYDLVEYRAGVVIIGANGFLNQLRIKAEKNIESFPQVLRRFGAAPLMLSAGIDMADAVTICAAYGITSRSDVAQLVAHCRDYGTLFSTLAKGKSDREALDNGPQK